MARKQKHEEHENHERWLVSYADFITLLFAFFVVMYSISSVNEGKYRVLSDTLESTFKKTGKSDKPIQVGELARTLNPFNEGVQSPSAPGDAEAVVKPLRPAASKGDTENTAKMLEALASELGGKLGKLQEQKLVTVRRNKNSVEVELKSKLLFQSGSARLSIDAEKLLIGLAATLSRFPTAMQVEGHTDDTPISNAQYPSNWELSSARAATVVNLFAEHDVDPARMWAVGYAQYRPYSTLDTDSERERNRRVVLRIRPNYVSNFKPTRFDRNPNRVVEVNEAPVEVVPIDPSKIDGSLNSDTTPTELPPLAPRADTTLNTTGERGEAEAAPTAQPAGPAIAPPIQPIVIPGLEQAIPNTGREGR